MITRKELYTEKKKLNILGCLWIKTYGLPSFGLGAQFINIRKECRLSRAPIYIPDPGFLNGPGKQCRPSKTLSPLSVLVLLM